MTLEQSLQSPFVDDLAPLEPLRQLVLGYAHSDVTQAAGAVVRRAMETDLRALFPPPPIGSTPSEPTDGEGNTLRFSKAVDNANIQMHRLEKVLTKAKVPSEEQVLIRKYLEHGLPQRRVAALCALVCLCSGRRG